MRRRLSCFIELQVKMMVLKALPAAAGEERVGDGCGDNSLSESLRALDTESGGESSDSWVDGKSDNASTSTSKSRSAAVASGLDSSEGPACSAVASDGSDSGSSAAEEAKLRPATGPHGDGASQTKAMKRRQGTETVVLEFDARRSPSVPRSCRSSSSSSGTAAEDLPSNPSPQVSLKLGADLRAGRNANMSNCPPAQSYPRSLAWRRRAQAAATGRPFEAATQARRPTRSATAHDPVANPSGDFRTVSDCTDFNYASVTTHVDDWDANTLADVDQLTGLDQLPKSLLTAPVGQQHQTLLLPTTVLPSAPQHPGFQFQSQTPSKSQSQTQTQSQTQSQSQSQSQSQTQSQAQTLSTTPSTMTTDDTAALVAGAALAASAVKSVEESSDAAVLTAASARWHPQLSSLKRRLFGDSPGSVAPEASGNVSASSHRFPTWKAETATGKAPIKSDPNGASCTSQITMRQIKRAVKHPGIGSIKRHLQKQLQQNQQLHPQSHQAKSCSRYAKEAPSNKPAPVKPSGQSKPAKSAAARRLLDPALRSLRARGGYTEAGGGIKPIVKAKLQQQQRRETKSASKRAAPAKFVTFMKPQYI